MKLGDVGVLAEAIENCLPEIARNNNGEDVRRRLKISLSVSPEELDGINSELYAMTNHALPPEDLPRVDAVDLELVGIDFVISSSSADAFL